MTGRPPAADAGPPPSKGLFRSRLRDARIRSKLGLILVIPLIAVLVLAGLRLWDSGQRAIAADQVRSLAAVSVEAAHVSHLLHRERMEAARLIADPERDASMFNSRSADTDEAVEQYEQARAALGTVPQIIEVRLDRIEEHFSDLGAIRQQILDDTPVTVSAAVLRYGVVLDDVLTYQETVSEIAQDPDLTEQIRAVAALAKAKTHAAEAEAIALVGLADGSLSREQLAVFLGTQTGQQEAFLTFSQTADPSQQAAVNAVVTGGNVVFADRAAAAMIRSVDGDLAMAPESAVAALGGLVNSIRWVEEQLLNDLMLTSTELREGVFQQVLLEAVLAVVLLALAVGITVFLARSLARSLGALRDNALTVAEHELPDTVERLSDPSTLGENTPEELANQVRAPIQLHGRDEIGEVAQAFNVVHREAVRVAAEQAALRTSVSAMFLNLARRSQSLVDRMISQLDEIERNEEDPKRLAKLFALDHLATRMRRNDENLLVLAGADSSPPRGDDAAIADILRASQSEVEHYARIEFGTVDSDVSVVSHTVNDVVRLLAELFDNATRFSPPDTAVVCEARRLGDQLIIQVEDRGVGMPDEQVDRLNAWLAAPPSLEVTTFRKMGLAVVARLADRHGIRVELRCDPNYGTIAYVSLPPAILILPRSRARSMEVPVPRAPLAAEPASPPTPSRHLSQLPRRSPGATTAPQSWQQEPATTTSSWLDQDQQAGHSWHDQPTGVHEQASTWQAPGRSWHDQPTEHTPTTTGQPDAQTGQFDLPVAGRPLYELTSPPQQPSTPAGDNGGYPPRSAPPTPPSAPTGGTSGGHAHAAPEATVELPIFHEMEQSWFRSHGNIDLGRQVEARRQAQAQQSAAGSVAGGAPASASGTDSPIPSPRDSRGHTADTGASTTSAGNEAWRTAADSGWQAAAAAAEPTSGGATRSGLPKRVPQAQLVPGSVDPRSAEPKETSSQRRSPEEIRGLLSAYHRGVQRGRESGAR